MARSTAEILESIKKECRENVHFLKIVDNKSSAFYYLCYIIAKTINVYEQILDFHKKYITTIIKEQKIGTAKWYVEKIKEFQEGVALNDLGEYDNIDKSKQIIKHCSINEDRNDGILYIKIKGENSAITDSNKINQIKAYINLIKFAGTETLLESKNANKIKLNGLQIKYEPLIHNDEKELEKLVKNAINAYLNYLPFNSVFYLQEMLNNVENITGIKSVYIGISDIIISDNDGSNQKPLGSPTVIVDSGWLELDTNSSYDFETI